jgi:hypothetical protein
MENQVWSDSQYFEVHLGFTLVAPPMWTTCDPTMWEQERDRAASMSRAARAHMPKLVDMFDAWRRAWNTRATRYADAVKGRDAAAVAAVLDSADQEGARRAFKLARAYQAEIDALIAAPWGAY